MKHFNSCIVEKYKDAFVYIVLYINEAHPSNGWFIGDGVYTIANHTCIQDRKIAAQYLDDDLHPDVHVLLDNVENQGQKVFGTKYERLYVLQEGRVLYQGGNGPFGYNLDDLDEFLKGLSTPN